MPKPFRFDAEKFLASKTGQTQIANSSQIPHAAQDRQHRPGLPPTVRGLPWAKMLRSFREKSS